MTTEGVAATASQRIAAKGLILPPATTPAGAYSSWVRSGDLVFLSGHLCREQGAVLTGAVGDTVDTATGTARARLCALELLATIDAAVGVDAVRRVVKLTGFVNCVNGFAEQTAVLNGASELFAEVFGDAGRHARSAVGVPGLPLNASVEVEAVVEVG